MNTHLHHAAKSVVERLKHAGFLAYFAGGYARDRVMGIASSDIDIATSAPPRQVQRLFPRNIAVGAAFGVIVVQQHGYSFEVATFRKDLDYSDGRRPNQVEWSAPQEDAQRRDFTINGLFYDPIQEQLIDFVQGKQDIEMGVIRAIGDPFARFEEDRLRMIRAARFSHRFHFPIEEQTERAILSLASSLRPAVAVERIWQELQKMHASAHFDAALMLLHRLQLLGAIFPSLHGVLPQQLAQQLAPCRDFPAGTPAILYLLALFPHHSQQQLLLMAKELKVANVDLTRLQQQKHACTLLEQEQQSGVSLAQWLRFDAEEDALLYLAVAEACRSQGDVSKQMKRHSMRQETYARSIAQLKEKVPFLSARRLMQEGVPPGKSMGLLLKQAEEIALMRQLFDEETVLQQLKTTSLWTSSSYL